MLGRAVHLRWLCSLELVWLLCSSVTQTALSPWIPPCTQECSWNVAQELGGQNGQEQEGLVWALVLLCTTLPTEMC